MITFDNQLSTGIQAFGAGEIVTNFVSPFVSSNVAPNETFSAPYRVSSCEEDLQLQFKIFDLAGVEMRRKENLILQLQEQVRLLNVELDNLRRQLRGFTMTPPKPPMPPRAKDSVQGSYASMFGTTRRMSKYLM